MIAVESQAVEQARRGISLLVEVRQMLKDFGTPIRLEIEKQEAILDKIAGFDFGIAKYLDRPVVETELWHPHPKEGDWSLLEFFSPVDYIDSLFFDQDEDNEVISYEEFCELSRIAQFEASRI